MQLPFKRFILALMADRICGVSLKKTLVSHGLPLPSIRDLLNFETELLGRRDPALVRYLTKPGRNTKYLDQKLQKRIRRLELSAYFEKNGSYPEAETLLRRRDLRFFLETLILANLPIPEIIGLFAQRFALTLTETQLQLYRHFFFDPGVMGGTDWNCYLAGLKDPHEAALKISALKNPDNLVYLKWKAGFDVDLEYPMMLRRLMTDAYFRLAEFMAKPMIDADKMTQMSLLMMRAGDRLEKFKHPDEADDFDRMSIMVEAAKRAHVLRGLSINVGQLPPIDETKPQLVVLPGSKGRPPEDGP